MIARYLLNDYFQEVPFGYQLPEGCSMCRFEFF